MTSTAATKSSTNFSANHKHELRCSRGKTHHFSMQHNWLHKIHKHLFAPTNSCYSAQTRTTTVSTFNQVHNPFHRESHPMSTVIGQVEDSDMPLIDDNDESPWQNAANQWPPYTEIPEGLHGNPGLKETSSELRSEFSSKLAKSETIHEPADIPSMGIKIIREKRKKHKGTRLPISSSNSYKTSSIRATNKQMMRDFNILQPSDAIKLAQMVLVPKPQNIWRFYLRLWHLQPIFRSSSQPANAEYSYDETSDRKQKSKFYWE